MTDILVLGGTGYAGRLIVRYLLQHSDATVTIATRHLYRAQSLADELNRQHPGQRVGAVFADAADESSLRSAFPGHRLVVVAAPTTAHTETVIRVALDEGVDYLDVQLSATKLALLESLATRIKDAGHCFITEAGFHPGLPAALVRYTASHMDTLETANTIGYLNFGKSVPYTDAVDEVADMFLDYRGQVLRDGRWTRPHSYQMRRFDLGSDIGRRLCYSMYFDELRPLPDQYPSLQELGFYISESHWVTDFVITPLVWIMIKAVPRSAHQAGRLFWWSMRNFARDPQRVELQVQASGVKDGQPVRVRASVAHLDGYALTAIPVVAALMQYLDGSARRPGLWMMGHLVDPVRLLADMGGMGVEVTTSVT